MEQNAFKTVHPCGSTHRYVLIVLATRYERKHHMTTHVPPQDEQSADATSTVEELQAAMSTHPSASQPVVLPKQPEEEEFFSFEEEQPDLEAAFAAPFQRSNAMPT